MAGPVKKHSGKLLFPGSGSRRKWFAQFNTARFIRNVLVTVICLAGMGLSVWYFRFDLDNSVRQLQETPFGYVYWTTGTIGRQSAGRTEERLEKFAQIYNGDIISTAPFSGAKISFVNGEILELAEQTVVRITYSLNETPYFELLDGDIHIQSGWNTLTVSAVQSSVVQGTTVQSKPIKTLLNPRTSADIRTEGDFSVRLFRGSGVLSREEQTSDIAEGQAFKIDFDNFTLSKLPVLMETPRNGTRILRTTPGIAPVKFQWSGGVIADAENAGDVIADDTGNADSGSGDTVTLVLSRTRDFSDPVETWTGADENSVEFDLAEGIYYWTLSQNGNSGAADSGSLEIIYSTGSIALSPSAGSIETQYPGQNEVRFHWTVPDEAEAVLLEVADNPEMSRPRIRQLVRRTGGGYGSYASTDIGPGKWYWRVYPVFTGDVSEGENNLAQIAGNHGYWRIRPVNTNVMADNSPSQVNPFTVAESFDTPAVLNQSDILINAVAGYSPVIVYPPDNYTVESSRTPDLVFAWKNPVLFNARFQVAERSDFTGTMLMDEDVYGSSIQSVFLEPGAYYWRVTGSGPAGPGESRPSRLVVEPLLTAPKLNTPAENASISMADSISVIFSWTKANYADYYMFRLYTEGKTDPLTEITSLQNTSIQVAFDPNTTGNFRWTVQGFTSPTGVSSLRKGLITEGNFAVIPRTRAVQAGSQTAWAVPRIENIEIKQGEVQSPITLKYPAIGTSIPGLEILRSPPT
ncbi:MAG: hypothetical protein FWD78_14810, partial [Treponema sp.]|nr:hypothetical protein [Treponema sp.]